MADDATYMRRALDLAAQARGRTSPNPMVGCVIVRDDTVIGEGYHRRAGEAHAEIVALQSVGDASGTTFYISLEPCCHFGKTPPCVESIIAAKPARVVVAMEDPNPQVSGRGLGELREAGIRVESGVLENEARILNEAFIKYITTGLPFVIVKCAMTLDGKIATRTGDSKWVTGEAARHYVHELRNTVDAILVGSRTVMLDDPSLTTRLGREDTRDPIRVVLDSDEYLDTSRRIFHHDSQAPTWLATTLDREHPEADAVINVPVGPCGGVSMGVLMRELGAREVTSVLIEGGGATHASAFEAGIVDKVLFFVAPKIIGGREAVGAVEGEGISRMEDAVAIQNLTARAIGEDLLLEGYVSPRLSGAI